MPSNQTPPWKLYASNSKRWLGCTGSPRLEASAPKGDRAAADKGTSTAEVGEKMILDLCRAIEPSPTNYPGIITEEYDTAETYARIVVDHCRHAGIFAMPNLMVEQKFPLPLIPNLGNVKPDALLWDAKAFELHVFDLKSGYTPVKAAGNPQLILGALSAIERFKIPLSDERVKVCLHIVQPKNYLTSSPDDMEVLTLTELARWVPWIIERATAANDLNAPCTPGTECIYCRARGTCEAFGTVVEKMIGYVHEGDISAGGQRTPQELSREAIILETAARVVDQRLTGITMEIEETLRSGKRVPLYDVERARGWETWTASDKVIIEFLAQYKADPMRVATPNQVRKSTLVPDNVIDMLSTRKPGKLKLKRIDTAKIAKRFEQ